MLMSRQIKRDRVSTGLVSSFRLVFVSVMLLPAAAAEAATAFQLNFNNQLPSSTLVGCANQDCTVAGGDRRTAGSNAGGNDGTRFIQEQLQIGSDLFFHVVVGDPATGFASESYTRSSKAAAINATTGTLQGNGANPFSPDQGGNEGFSPTSGVVTRSGLPNSLTLFGNGQNPFSANSHLTGNGTADPSRTVLRMTLSDGEMSLEVSKPVLNRKPLISQLTTDNKGMTSEFVADLRGISYSEANRPTPVVNRLHIVDATLPSPGSADFDMSRAQVSTVTAGRYSFTPGRGWIFPDGTTATKGWSDSKVDASGNTVTALFETGSYTGPGAGVDPLNVNWASFFSRAQNNGACNFPGSTRVVKGVCP